MNIIKLNKMKHTPAVICGRMPFINVSRLLETCQHPDIFRNYPKKHEPEMTVQHRKQTQLESDK